MTQEQVLAVALPDSLLVDEDNIRGKTVKIGQIARACSIFGVNRIYIYRDSSGNFERDYRVTREILEYAETPQYLRKRLIARKGDLENVGLLPPLRIPHHLAEPKPLSGETREAVLFFQSGKLMADIGAKEAAEYSGRGQAGQRVTVRVDSAQSPFRVSEAPRPMDRFWGYEVRRAPTLARFLRSLSFDLIILTSRSAAMVSDQWTGFQEKLAKSSRVLLCFGSPEKGVEEMLAQDRARVTNFPEALHLNTFPSQQVASVRLEEALLGTLSILNVARHIKS